MVNNTQERLNNAIRLSKRGETKEARKILLQLIQENSNNEYAWLWLIDVCDSDRERKAILSRGMKLNPKSKLLQTAMKRFVDTGSLVLEGDSLDSLIVETKVEEITEDKKPKQEERDPLAGDASDLDWIRLEDQSDGESDTLDTISEDEFFRLSQEYFIQDDESDEEIDIENVDSSEDLDVTKEKAPTSDSGLFLLDEILQEESDQNESTLGQSAPFINFDESKLNEEKADAIEDRLKGALDEGGKKKSGKRLNLNLPDFKTVIRYVLVILVSILCLIGLVLGGLYVIKAYDLDSFLNSSPTEVVALTPTEILSETPQPTSTPEEVEAFIEITLTPTPVPVQPVSRIINVDTLDEIVPLETFTQPFPMIFDSQGETMAVLDLKTIRFFDADGQQLWAEEMVNTRAIGGGFSEDRSLFGIFSDNKAVKVWDSISGNLVNEFALSDELKQVYSVIPYLPQDANASIHFSVNNELVAAAFWGGVTVWDLSSGNVVHEYSLPQSTIEDSFDDGTDLNFTMDFNPVNFNVAYGNRDDLYLVDIVSENDPQNWKTQYVGSLDWISENQFIEVGYPLNQLSSSYLSLWETGERFPIFTEYSLKASRGLNLPKYDYLEESSSLAFETESEEGKTLAVKVISTLDGQALNTIELETAQPILGILDVANETIIALWIKLPKEGFGVEDSIQFWDIDRSELVSVCQNCTFLSGLLADHYGLFINDDATFITQYAEGIGSQQLGIPSDD